MQNGQGRNGVGRRKKKGTLKMSEISKGEKLQKQRDYGMMETVKPKINSIFLRKPYSGEELRKEDKNGKK